MLRRKSEVRSGLNGPPSPIEPILQAGGPFGSDLASGPFGPCSLLSGGSIARGKYTDEVKIAQTFQIRKFKNVLYVDGKLRV